MTTPDTPDIRKGTCTKCAADTIHHNRDQMKAGTGSRLTFWGSLGPTLDHYICVTCGYTEAYLVSGDRSTIREKWTQVKPPPRSPSDDE